MEPFIFALIIAALGAFFNNKKNDAGKENPESSQKPQGRTAGNAGQKTFKRVEDYAKEIYGEFQTQMNGQPERREQVERKVEEVKERIPRRQAAKEVPKKHGSSGTGRLSAHQSRSAAVSKAPEEEDALLPLSSNDVQKGIIMAEILLPPKSKR